MRIIQLLPAAHVGDATGDAALALADALRQRGAEAELYALEIDPPLRGSVRPFKALVPPGPDDVTVLHFTLPSPLSAALRGLAGRRVLVYHNLTPPELLLPHCPEIARLTALGRRELRQLAADRVVDLAIGVSAYNTTDLRAAGFRDAVTVPLLVDLRRLAAAPDPLVLARYADDTPTFLTVGRLAPNKRLEDLLKIAAYYLRYISPRARFLVVGGGRGLEAHVGSLHQLHAALGLDERVRFTGRVPLGQLIAYYRVARVYVCTSQHEGFCVPLLEAMNFGLPILARRAAAVPETLGDAGILARSDDPAEWAEMLHLLATDDGLRRRLAQRAAARLRSLDLDAAADRWLAALSGGRISPGADAHTAP